MQPRKYFLDWLRVLAFAGLVLFHVGMLYVSWRYNLKSPRIYPSLEWPMEALSPWRMVLLFLISGVACRFLLEKLGARGFALSRLTRLGVVVLTGMLLVNPLQVWLQLLAQGDTAKGYLEFWGTSYLVSDPAYRAALGRPTPTWDHLWFLVYLLAYSLLLAGIMSLARPRARTPMWFLLGAPAALMALTNVLMATVAPFTHSLVNDWAAHLKWSGLFAVGAALAFRDDAWGALAKYRWRFVSVAAALMAIYLGIRGLCMSSPESLSCKVGYRISEGLYGWSMVLAICGVAAQFNHPSRTLDYLTEAVLPVYVLHQPLMLAAAFILFPLGLPVAIEVLALLVAAGVAPFCIYHLAIRPWPPTRFLFGLKARAPATPGYVRREASVS